MIDEAVTLAERSGASGSANTPFVLDALRNLSGGKTVAANWALVESNVSRGTRVATLLSQLEQQAKHTLSS